MSLCELLNVDDAEASNRERMSLGLDPHVFVMIDVADNSSLRNENKNILREAHVEHGIIIHKCNQRKDKMKEVNIVVKNASAEQRYNDLDWSDDESEDEEVGSAPAPTEEKIENKLNKSLEK